MVHVFPQDLKVGDIIHRGEKNGTVLSYRVEGDIVEVNVRLGTSFVDQWRYSKSDFLEILTTEQMDLYEKTTPEWGEDSVVTKPNIQSIDSENFLSEEPSAGLDIDSTASTIPVGFIPTIEIESNLLKEAKNLKS